MPISRPEFYKPTGPCSHCNDIRTAQRFRYLKEKGYLKNYIAEKRIEPDKDSNNSIISKLRSCIRRVSLKSSQENSSTMNVDDNNANDQQQPQISHQFDFTDNDQSKMIIERWIWSTYYSDTSIPTTNRKQIELEVSTK